jgi:hypothetical protein
MYLYSLRSSCSRRRLRRRPHDGLACRNTRRRSERSPDSPKRDAARGTVRSDAPWSRVREQPAARYTRDARPEISGYLDYRQRRRAASVLDRESDAFLTGHYHLHRRHHHRRGDRPIRECRRDSERRGGRRQRERHGSCHVRWMDQLQRIGPRRPMTPVAALTCLRARPS